MMPLAELTSAPKFCCFAKGAWAARKIDLNKIRIFELPFFKALSIAEIAGVDFTAFLIQTAKENS
jgi:hypothetical protein